MYEFSLGYVKKLYEQGLTKADSAAITELRIKKLNESITRVMFTNISRALFEAHKKLYSFLICCEIKKNAKIIDVAFSQGEKWIGTVNMDYSLSFWDMQDEFRFEKTFPQDYNAMTE